MSSTTGTFTAPAPYAELLASLYPFYIYVVKLLGYLSYLFSFFGRIFSFFYTIALAPALYLLSPVTALLSISFNAFVSIPLSIVKSVIEFFHPIYTFLGASLIVAGLLGWAAKTLVWIFQEWMHEKEMEEEEEQALASRIKLEVE